MLPHYTSTKDMSDRQIRNLIADLEAELQDRFYNREDQVFEDALTMGQGVQDIDPIKGFPYEGFTFTREDFIAWLKGRGSHHPASKKFLDEWEDYCAQEDIKESMRGDH